MRTAETILKEYLEQGYSLPALRALADSRSEPLRSEMSVILDRLEYLVPAQSAEAAQEDAVFFMAEDDEITDCEAVIDFNVMAEETPAEAVEVVAPAGGSVAGIVIGETDGSEMVELLDVPVQERAAQSSGDYLPAASVKAAAPEEPEADVVAELSGPAADHEETVMAQAAPLAPSLSPNKQESRSERRRRVRAEKRKLKKLRHGRDLASRTMPEIILSTSEAPDTLQPTQALADSVEDEEYNNNIIAFHPKYPVESGEDESGEADDGGAPRLRMLTLDEVTEEPESLASLMESDGAGESYLSDERIMLTMVPETPELNREALIGEVRKELEKEFHERMSEISARLAETQSLADASDLLVREQKNALDVRGAELDAKSAELDAVASELASIRKTVSMLEEAGQSLRGELDETLAEDARKQAKLNEYAEIMGEHERLYKEFEDLRVAYNEVVGDVMPALQKERDDLVLTVERQCESESRLRSSLGSARKRLTVGYSLGAAAVGMLVVLPVFNWMRSGHDEREFAYDSQRVGELREQLEKAELQNLENEKHIFNLERKVDLQLAELGKMSDKRTMENAMSRSGASAASTGTPIRVSDMALSGPMDSNGLLRYNDVRDPAGSIDSQVAMNRSRRESAPSQPQSSGGRIAVSSRARTSTGGSAQIRQAPAAAERPVDTRTAAVSANTSRKDMTTAKVKAGEGVAQVVYRVLGTRNPEVIDWVIRENNIKNDRRGNPRIYPDQELRLPKDGTSVQSASIR